MPDRRRIGGVGVLAQAMPKSLGHPGSRRPWPVNMGVPKHYSDGTANIPSLPVRQVDVSLVSRFVIYYAPDFRWT